MANGNEIARAYVTIVPSMQGSQSTITSELTGITTPASETAGEESGKHFGESLAKGLKATAGIVAGAMTAITAGAVATGKAFIDATKDVATYGDQVDKESQKMHISAEAYQEWDFILQHAGSSVEGMKTAMKTLTAQAESGSDAFEALGLSTEQIASMSQEELFGAVITGLQGIEDESERTVLAQSLLGRSSVEMTALFNMSAEETEDLRNQVHELGGVMSDEAVKASAGYADSLQNLETSFSGLKKNLMSEFLPSVTKTMDGLAKVFSGDKSGIGDIQEGIKGVISDLTALAPEFFSLAQTLIFSLLEGFAPMLPSLVQTLFSITIQAITTLTSLLPSLMPSIISGIQGIFQALFQALPVITSSLFQLVMSLVTWLSEDGNIESFIQGIIQVVVLIVEQFAQILPILLPAIVKIVGEVVNALLEPDTIMMLVGAVLELVGAIFVALVNCVPEFIDFVIGLVDNLSDLVVKFLDWIVPIISKGLTNVINTVKSWGENIKNFVVGIWNHIKTGVSNFITTMKNNFANGFNAIKTNISNVINNIKNFVDNILNRIKALPDQAKAMGHNLIAGFWNGISNMIDWVIDKVSGFADSIVSTVKKAFGIHSPSRVFRDIGDNLGTAIGIGFDDSMSEVESDMLKATDGLTASMTADVTAYGAQASTLSGSEVNNFNGGSISINVYGAEGQNINDLAEVIAIKLDNMTRRKGSVYA
jgi:phage-related protein